MKGFYQLANQLSLHNASVELVESVVSMVTGFHWLPLEEQLDDDEGGTVSLSSMQLAALSPLLALLPQTVHNLPLAHSLLHFLQRLFTKVLFDFVLFIIHFLLLPYLSIFAFSFIYLVFKKK